MCEILSYHILMKVKIRWIVTYLDLRRTRSPINGIEVYGPRIKVHCLRVGHLRCMIGCRWRMQTIMKS